MYLILLSTTFARDYFQFRTNVGLDRQGDIPKVNLEVFFAEVIVSEGRRVFHS